MGTTGSASSKGFKPISVRRNVERRILRFSLCIGAISTMIAALAYGFALRADLRDPHKVNTEALAEMRCDANVCDTSDFTEDPYAAYDQIGGPKMVHAGCWSHAERYFSEAVQLNPQDPVATAIVARIDELFAIESRRSRQYDVLRYQRFWTIFVIPQARRKSVHRREGVGRDHPDSLVPNCP
jgi:hypothetical protein